MSEQVFQKLAKLDRGVADAYKKALPGDPKGTIDISGATAILNEVVDSDTKSGKPSITTSEAAALLMVIQYAPLSQEAVDFIAKKLVEVTKNDDTFLMEALAEGNAIERLQGQTLQGIMDLVDITAYGEINFTSPGTTVTFSPQHYEAIKAFVSDGTIEVLAVKDSGLVNEFFQFGASYRSDSDKLFIYAQSNALVLKSLLVHEITHAIQDWLDKLDFSHTAVEADGYIAGAMALKKLNPKMKPLGGIYKVAYDKAIPFIEARKATLDNKDWKAAYKLVQDEVGKDQGYGDMKKRPDKAGRNEKQLMERKLNEIKKSRKSTTKSP